jgi:hypothetical protein
MPLTPELPRSMGDRPMQRKLALVSAIRTGGRIGLLIIAAALLPGVADAAMALTMTGLQIDD